MATVIFTSVNAKVWPMQFLYQTETQSEILHVGKIQCDKSSGVGTKTPSRDGVSYYFVFFLLFSLNQIIKQYSQQIKNGPVNPSGPQNGVWKKICHKGKYNRTLYSFICSARHQVNSLTLRPLTLFSSRMSCTYNRCTLCTLAHTTAVHYIDDDDNWPSRDYKREWVQTFDAEISGVVLVGKELIIHDWLMAALYNINQSHTTDTRGDLQIQHWTLSYS